jgi:hypothetical protein
MKTDPGRLHGRAGSLSQSRPIKKELEDAEKINTANALEREI